MSPDLIHPTAVIHTDTKIGKNVEISPYAVIGEGVVIGDETWIGPHVVIQGPTTIGKQNRIYQFASIGEVPQDKKYRDEPTTLEIGDRNVIRECCTINRGTVQDKGTTVVGNDNWIMAYVHIAHDCIIGNNTVFANNATLAGHVTIRDHVILGGFTLVHQFCQVGEYAFTGMGAALGKDLPPFVMATGAPAVPRGINNEGLKRHHFEAAQRARIKEAYRILYRMDLPFREALERLDNELGHDSQIRLLIDFCRQSQRGIIR